MNHAFLITAYKDAPHLCRLVHALKGNSSFIFIHVDKKSDLFEYEAIQQLSSEKNVFFLQNRVNVFWGGFSHLKVILELLQEAFKNKGIQYFHCISGQDFPAVPLAKFDEFFSERAGKEFMTCAPLDKMNWSGGSFNRIQLYHLNDAFNIRVKFWKRINARFLQFQRFLGVKRKLPAGVHAFYGGGTWWSISAKAVAFIFQFLSEDPGFLRRFRKTHCAEEIFFQTLLMNSPLKDNVVSEDLRYIDWETRNGNCPACLDERDFEKINKSGKLFARKIESGTGDKLVELLSGKKA